MTQVDPTPRYADLLSNLLDRGYNSAARVVTGSIARNVTNGVLDTRLNQLLSEAERLATSGEPFTAENPVLRALLADFSDSLNGYGASVQNSAETLTTSAMNAAARFSRETLIGEPPVWNVPDPEAVAAAVTFTQSQAWQAEIEAYTSDGVQGVQAIAIRGIVSGLNPIAIAREIRRFVEGYPRYRAETMMRTLQLQSYRAASAIHQRANADILAYQIRVGTLDARICLCCISLHGTRLPVGEVVQDHWNGRCTSIAVVRGHERSIQTGEEWYAAQDAVSQRGIAGHANYEAMQAGRVQLRDFAQPVNDPIYGQMVHEASLVSLIGSDARQFYRRGV